MDKYIYDEKNGLWYELQGDYYLPCLELPEEEPAHIGVWGQRHLRYLKQYRKVRYYNLLTSGKLNEYLAEIDRQAQDMFLRLIKEIGETEGITESLKSTDSTEWVKIMNNISNRAMESVNTGFIFE